MTDFSCIASSKADWVLGVARLISSARTRLAKTGSGLELELPAAFGALDHDVGADQVGGHQVGRELDPGELHLQGVGEGPDQEGLAQPRHAFEEDVAARDEGRQGAFDDVLVADDHLGDLGSEGVEARPELIELLLQFLDVRHGNHRSRHQPTPGPPLKKVGGSQGPSDGRRLVLILGKRNRIR